MQPEASEALACESGDVGYVVVATGQMNAWYSPEQPPRQFVHVWSETGSSFSSGYW